MIVDGRAIAALIYKEIGNEISHMRIKPHLTVFTCAPNFETQKYLALKRRKAHDVGISLNVIEFPETVTTDEVVTSIQHALMQTDGIVVQLPFPQHIAIDEVLSVIPASYDVDAVSYDGTNDLVLPPVVGAINEIAKMHMVVFSQQEVAIVGNGRLVGAPSRIWCEKQGAKVTVLDKQSVDITPLTRHAKILILGTGVPALITPEMISEGVIIFDAGTSEMSGVLRGDADPACAQKASLFTPVPGGIGPITVAVLLRNLVQLASA